MAHTILREKATQLRLQGYTYSQIKRELGLSKSTLSGWLYKYPLSEERLKEVITDRNHKRDLAVERFRNTFREKRLNRLKATYFSQKTKLLPLTEKELFIAGLFLYWGEGGKGHGPITISNTDPKIISFALYWMTNSLGIPKEKIKVLLHIYRDMDIEESINFWAKTLEFSRDQFNKPYIKKTNREGLTYKSFGHGTCRLYAGSVTLSEKVAMSIKAISDYYGAKSDLFWYN